MPTDAKIPIMATTTNNSIKEKPLNILKSYKRLFFIDDRFRKI